MITINLTENKLLQAFFVCYIIYINIYIYLYMYLAIDNVTI